MFFFETFLYPKKDIKQQSINQSTKLKKQSIYIPTMVNDDEI